MSVRSYDIPAARASATARLIARASRISANKLAAVMLWLASVYTTGLIITTLHPNEADHMIADVPYIGGLLGWLGIDWRNLAFAVAVQVVLTLGEQAIWRKQPADTVAIIALLTDIGANIAGLYPYMKHFGNTALWGVVVDVVHIDPTFSPLAALILALFGSIIVAAGPEILWSRDKRRRPAEG